MTCEGGNSLSLTHREGQVRRCGGGVYLPASCLDPPLSHDNGSCTLKEIIALKDYELMFDQNPMAFSKSNGVEGSVMEKPMPQDQQRFLVKH